MNLKVLLFYLNFIPFISYSEDTLTIDLTDSLNLINYLSNIEKNQKSNEEWFKNLTEKGVSSGEKEIYFSEEAIILLNDSIFRDKIYKDEYTLYDVGISLSNLDIKLAFWQMINIYPEKKDTLIKYIYAYDKILPVDEIVLASFYTYAFFDPKITRLDTGKPEVYRPDIFEDYFDEGEALSKVDTGTGKQLSDLVRKLRKVEDQIADAEQYLKTIKAEKHKLSTENIPALMDEMGMDRVDVDGLTVTRKMIVSASIPQDRKEEAFAWLRENGLDDIIKNDITCSFGKGEDNLAGDVVGLLHERGFDPKTKTHVHPSTLKAFVKERVTDGKPIDLDMFGAYINNAAEIRRKA